MATPTLEWWESYCPDPRQPKTGLSLAPWHPSLPSAIDSMPEGGNKFTAGSSGSGETYLAAYIQNNLPTTLIYLPEMRLVGKDAMRALARTEIQKRAQLDSWKWPGADLAPASPRWGSKEIVETYAKDVLQYAILSHRWGTDERAFQEMARSMQWADHPHAGNGFRKLHGFCWMAALHGCAWAWSDTFCIDKTSSVDLNEAIRSMFRWYRDAHICIVYLADTEAISELGRDSWFTRAWTLQELLASTRLKFFSNSWKPLTRVSNDKSYESHLVTEITRATRVNYPFLQRFIPNCSDIRMTMCWAAGREATRTEDVAYSLAGIFNVDLSIAYGEGDRAFYRLQLALMQTFRAVDVLSWCGKSSTASSVLARSPAEFAKVEEVTRMANCEYYGGKRLCQMTNLGLRIDAVLYRVRVRRGAAEEDTLHVDVEMCAPDGMPVIAVKSTKMGHHWKTTHWPYSASNRIILEPSLSCRFVVMWQSYCGTRAINTTITAGFTRTVSSSYGSRARDGRNLHRFWLSSTCRV